MQSSSRTIGLIAGGFKPFTAGHYNLVQKASRDCDEVKLFVSVGDRKREGEFALTWTQMCPIWNEYLEPMLMKLGNVTVIYAKQPIRSVYELLIEVNENCSDSNRYVVYSDPNDMQKSYSSITQMRYWSRLVKNNEFHLHMVERGETGGISGTVMRKALAQGKMKAFIAGLPEPVRLYGSAIYDMIKNSD